ncbi:hypothetical protein Ddye_018639 [Dipteronia dyeriana]|uniref:Formin-like protein n=1 Tax=Dipteronia dyeriana TaxID=168575 RepID=A0AAD9X251_9ROSI|nr:hypothetical protein Ddye_018639 [Dipteronia dyeriana]
MLCFFFFLVLTYSPLQLTCTSIANRRILHQPFFPLNSLPPSQPPSLPPPSPPPSPSPPANPKFPFSSSSSNSGSTPNQSPFFPSYPVSPPPPGPATFASFPANISSLILPHSTNKPKPNSQKLLILALASVLSAVAVAGILVFLYCRKRRRKSFIDQKDTFYSQNGETTTTRSSSNNNISATTSQKLRATRTSSSSEFLYLGTLVNSRSGAIGDDGCGGDATVIASSNSHAHCESPELRPLPPLLLTQQASFNENPGNAATAVSSAAAGEEEEEDEEFYSPRVSLGSGSRREFATTTVASVASLENDVDGGGRRNSVSSCCSCSSTSSRSLSASISPPASPSRIRSDPKYSDTAPPQHPPQSVFALLSPLQSSPDHHRNIRSPSLSIASTSPDITLSPRTYNVFNRNVLSSSTTASTTPDREYMTTQNINLEKKNPDVSSKMSSISSSASTSPDRELEMLEKNPDDEVSKSLNLLDANAVGSAVSVSVPVSASSSPEKKKSPDVSPRSSLSSASTSPERDSKRSQNASPRISNVSNQSRQQSSLSSSPVRSSDASPRISITSPVRLNDALEQPISALAPPPPPPPPPPARSRPTRRQWEIPVVTTPIGQPISQPPPLIPPSKPFVIQNPTKVSPIELTSSSNTLESVEEEASKPKLKPLHWDKVRASSDREMVWDHLRSSSFKLNEEMIETLFVVNTPNTKPNQATPRPVLPSPNQDNRVLDPKKAQNIAILLRALHVTIEEVCEALLEGNADTLGTELLESLLKMAPTKEEERKLKDYKDDSPVKLCSAEKFLKAVLDVPFAFKRVDAMLYITNFESEVEYLKRSFETLEAACEELRNSRMFLKLLEAVLKTGNRMNVGTNRGDAHAFKLDTLLKLVDVKGADGKTTLLHFVVQEMIRTEGARLSNQNPNSSATEDAKCRKLGLQVVSGLSSELTNVKKAAAMDSDVLSSDVAKLSKGLGNISEVVRLNETLGLDDSTKKFSESMNRFMRMAEEDMIRIQALESVALSLVKEITEYFHGNSAKEEAHPFRIFLVVRDFVTTLDRVCKEVGMINERTIISSAHKFPVPVNPMLQAAFTGSQERRQYSSSDDESAPH